MTIFAYGEGMKDMIITTPFGLILVVFLGAVGIYTMFGMQVTSKVRQFFNVL